MAKEKVEVLVRSAKDYLNRGDYKSLIASVDEIGTLCFRDSPDVSRDITDIREEHRYGIIVLISDFLASPYIKKTYSRTEKQSILHSLEQLTIENPDLDSCLKEFHKAGIKTLPV